MTLTFIPLASDIYIGLVIPTDRTIACIKSYMRMVGELGAGTCDRAVDRSYIVEVSEVKCRPLPTQSLPRSNSYERY